MVSKLRNSLKNEKIELICFFAFMIIGIFARVWQFGIVPGDINQDEAFAGYEAYSLLHYGMDSSGYHFPVYLTAWGSGMNALNTYLMIPFIAVFGLEVWVIRLPQLIVSCFTLWVVYLIVKRVINTKAALLALLLTAVCPWHIYLSRWGLESNLAPGFILFALYFFIKGTEKPKFLMLSALFYGLSLYTYATIWPVVPLMILLQLLYCFCYKKIKFTKELLFSGLILAAQAVPLLLFLLVNYGVIEEICTPVFSVPKLVSMRSGEISLTHIIPNARNLWHIVWDQMKRMPGDFSGKYGLFSCMTMPFFFIGLFYYGKQIIRNFRKKEFGYEIFIMIQFLAGIILGLLIHVNVTRVNILFIPVIIITASGMNWIFSLIHYNLIWFIIPFYLIQFVLFEHHYFTEYRQRISYHFEYGIRDALNEAMSHDGEIWITDKVKFSNVLFFSKEPVDEYLGTVKYKNYPDAFLQVESFGRFRFGIDIETPDTDNIYVLEASEDLTEFYTNGFTIENYGHFAVAYISENS